MSKTATQPRTFGERLRHAREDAGLTLEDVSYEMRRRLHRRLWISMATLSRWERETDESRGDTLMLAFLAHLYGVELGWLSPANADALASVSDFIDLTTSDADSRQSG